MFTLGTTKHIETIELFFKLKIICKTTSHRFRSVTETGQLVRFMSFNINHPLPRNKIFFRLTKSRVSKGQTNDFFNDGLVHTLRHVKLFTFQIFPGQCNFGGITTSEPEWTKS